MPRETECVLVCEQVGLMTPEVFRIHISCLIIFPRSRPTNANPNSNSQEAPMSTDPVVLITGATGDFGPHVVRAFAADGARLALTARKLEPAEALIRALGLSADRALPSVVDVTSAASVAAWIEDRKSTRLNSNHCY